MNPYKEILRKFFSKYVSTLRKRRGLTQEEMAEKLRITGRAYSDLERGIYCFSQSADIFREEFSEYFFIWIHVLRPPFRQISASSAKILSHHEVRFHVAHFVSP